ncbi:hypothetical protein [Streptomyces sp. Ncost-T10-10d]|uniref:hypothetical protein n=1 Tax=Streptomyces sp. Ncost-T10-10d TaxID=1839774 RepID=UPI00081EEDD5|nr:hypothetical protein [Streptomyces sp. Ncost-T10-10d]SCF98222.1 hypothetical protein GA0115254_128712 [Streptomyces sp. Ncost-T10-10d]
MATDPYAGHSTLALVLIIFVGLLVVGILGVYACTALARNGIRHSGTLVLLRSLAAFAAAGAVSSYVWGAIHLVTLDETRRDLACKKAVGPAHVMEIDSYRPTYIPLGLGCHVGNGTTYLAGVPGYLNPVAAGLALTAVVLGGFTALESERRVTKEFKRETRHQ